MNKYDAFISYRREDGFLMAQVIHDSLKQKGISCFMDLEELQAGRFNEKILSAIEEAPNFILILPPGALDRCTDEEDWVRIEILKAVETQKTIIPVMLSGFTWPDEHASGLPQQISSLRYQQSVSMTHEYLHAMIDKIISYMTEVNLEERQAEAALALREGASLKTSDFFRKAMKQLAPVEGVDMAFHSGDDWHGDMEKLEILSEFVSARVPIRILANNSEIMSLTARHRMAPVLKKQINFDQCIEDWKEIASNYPGQVQIRVLEVPLMHRLHIVRGQGGSAVSVKYYAYGPHTPGRDRSCCYIAPSDGYTTYQNEFDYLWQHASHEA